MKTTNKKTKKDARYFAGVGTVPPPQVSTDVLGKVSCAGRYRWLRW